MIVLGSANMDIVVRAERAPGPGETVFGHDYALYPGGKGANQAVGARRAGANVEFAGRIGLDAYGDRLIKALAAEGISLDATRRVETATGVALITVESSGENRIIVVPAANHEFALEDPGFVAVRKSVLLVQLEIPVSTVIAAAGMIRAGGGKVIMNASPIAGLTEKDRAALLDAADVLVVNEVEAAALLDIAPHEVMRGATADSVHQLARGRVGAVITLGASGAAWSAGDRVGQVPGHRTDVVDTTACGDAFAGAFASAIERGVIIPVAAAFGNAAGALAATKLGAQPSLPHRADIEALLRSPFIS